MSSGTDKLREWADANHEQISGIDFFADAAEKAGDVLDAEASRAQKATLETLADIWTTIAQAVDDQVDEGH